MDSWYSDELDYMDMFDQYSNSDYSYDGLYDSLSDYCFSEEEPDSENENSYEPPSSDEDPDLLEMAFVTRKRTKYKPEIPAAAIKKVIQEAMAEKGVKETDIPEDPFSVNMMKVLYSDSKTKGFAGFRCPNNHHRWPSSYSRCFVDLKNQSICHRDGQTCRKCNTEVMPEYSRESIQQMAEQAVREHLERTGKVYPQMCSAKKIPEEIHSDFHDMERCGKCKRQGSPCWK